MTFSSHTPRKRFGQNFLHDPYIINRIIQAINPQVSDHLVEIGPGQGALTCALLPHVKSMDCIELDRDLIPILENNCANLGELHIHSSDALKFDFATLTKNGAKLRIVGNLPYNISTPLLFHLLDYHSIVQDMHFMLQKEVVDRMAASHDSKSYGRLSIMVQYFCQVTSLFTVPPGAFNPPPKVDSAIVRLIPHSQLPYVAQDFSLFENLVRQAFSQRRKMLRNSLKSWLTLSQLESLSDFLTKRPEEITLEEYVEMSNRILS